MSQRYTSGDVDVIFAAHFRRFTATAAPQSLLAASETETTPRELMRFAEARFHGLVNTFAASFFDSWNAIGPPFRAAARNRIFEQGAGRMTALGLIAGKVLRTPESRTAKNGKSFATAVMREGTGDAVTWWNIVAFAETATELLQLKAGDVVSVSGPFTTEIYTKGGAQPRISHRIVADRIVAPRLSGRKAEP